MSALLCQTIRAQKMDKDKQKLLEQAFEKEFLNQGKMFLSCSMFRFV